MTGAVIDKGTRRISARVECPRLPADALKARLEDRLAFAYRVERVELSLSAPAQQAAEEPAAPVQEPAPSLQAEQPAAPPAPEEAAKEKKGPGPGGGGPLCPHRGYPPGGAGQAQAGRAQGEEERRGAESRSCSTGQHPIKKEPVPMQTPGAGHGRRCGGGRRVLRRPPGAEEAGRLGDLL